MTSLNDQLKHLPDSPGVYLFKNARGAIIYIGKATSLKKRVRSYFQKAHDMRIQKMVSRIASVETRPTASALEALLIEAQLIKKYLPPYNVMEKDDKTFAYIAITDEPIPRLIVTRPTKKEQADMKYLYGPYTSAQTARTALKILRRIFPFHSQPLPPRPLFRRRDWPLLGRLWRQATPERIPRVALPIATFSGRQSGTRYCKSQTRNGRGLKGPAL